MKLVLLSSLLLLVACNKEYNKSKNEFSQDLNSKVGERIFELIKEIPNASDRKLAFGALSSSEQEAVWKYKFYLMFQKYESQPQKMKFISFALSSFLKQTYDSSGAARRALFIKNESKDLYKQGSYALGSLDAFNFLYQLVPLNISDFPKLNHSSALGNKEEVYPNCECVYGEESAECFRIDEHNNVILGVCYDNRCENNPPSSGGCGMFGYQQCDGIRCRVEN